MGHARGGHHGEGEGLAPWGALPADQPRGRGRPRSDGGAAGTDHVRMCEDAGPCDDAGNDHLFEMPGADRSV